MKDMTLSIHNILCPTDFSESAASAFAEAVRLARWFGAKVTVAHVMPYAVPIAADMGYVPLSDVQDAAARKAALEELRRFVEIAEPDDVPIATVCRQGDPCGEIRALAKETAADLIVMGTHGRSGFKRVVLGSVTEAVLDHPPAPVLTVNRSLPPRTGPFRTVLCATDVSAWSAGTVDAALAMADEGAKRLIVLSVIEHRVDSSGTLDRAALAALRDMIPVEVPRAYPIDGRVAYGEPEREILTVAANEGADLVVMGTRGGSTLRHLFGSTVRRVVRDAACSVMVVPAGHAWRARDLVRTAGAES